jgi:phospholipase/carboxylesterase
MALNLEHRVQVPGGPAGRRWPAVVKVHGWLGNENVMSIFERSLPPDVVVVSPRAPLDMGEQGFGWYSRDDDPASFAQGLEALAEFVRGLPKTYPIDAGHVLLMGFSQGAAMCYSLLLREPALAAAVVGLAGFLPYEAKQWLAPDRLAGKPVFMAHGTEDETVPVARAREAAETLREAGADVELREYAVGHKVNAEGMRDLKAWLGKVIGNW